MVLSSTQRAINGVLWLASGAAVILIRFIFFQNEAFVGWMIIGILMILVGVYQAWKFQRLRRTPHETEKHAPSLP